MALFSSSEDWNLLTLTLLSALIHPVYKAASMPQFELQANIMATSKHHATTSVLVILSSPERICSRIRQEDGQGMKWKTLQCNHSRFMKDFWKVNSHVAENYIENVLKCRFVFLLCWSFFMHMPDQQEFSFSCFVLTQKPLCTKHERHKKKNQIALKYLTRASQSVSTEGLTGPCPQTFPGRPPCVYVSVSGAELWTLCRDRRVFRQGLPLMGLDSLRTVAKKRKHDMLGCQLHKQ